MANYNSVHTGEEIDLSVKSTVDLTTTSENLTVSGITFPLVHWSAAPTSSNQVYGFAMHPTNGKLYRIYNNKGTKTAEIYITGSEVDAKINAAITSELNTVH